MSLIRSFIAIELPPEIHSLLEGVIDQLKGRLSEMPIRWVPPNNIHLTLKFLGDVSASNLEMLEKILQSEANKQVDFEISIGELGVFPSLKRPRVIWTGVKAPPELAEIHRSIENEVSRLGYTRENRDFSPHLTLGRVSRSANTAEIRKIGGILSDCKVGFLGATRVHTIHLFRSDLKPGGAVYSKLYSGAFSS